jgi:Zn-finger nucleic acid-binding protein
VHAELIDGLEIRQCGNSKGVFFSRDELETLAGIHHGPSSLRSSR